MANEHAAEASPVRRLIERYFEAWRASTADKVLEYFTDDAVVTLLGDGAILTGKSMIGERWIFPMMKKYSDNTHHITSVIEAGDRIAVEWLFTAVYISTGKELRLKGCSVSWVRDNLIQRAHLYFTSLPETAAESASRKPAHPQGPPDRSRRA